VGHYDRIITYSDTCKMTVVADLKALKITIKNLSQSLKT